MGFPYHELITPAIILDNPGLTKEQITDKLRNVYPNAWTSYKKIDPWNIHSTRDFESDELPQILNLEYSQAFKDFQTPTKDSNGFTLNPPSLIPFFPESSSNNVLDLKRKYEVTIHIKNELGFTKLVKKDLWTDIEKGDITDLELGQSYDPQLYFIDEVIEKNSLQNEDLTQEEIEGDGYEESVPRYRYKLKVREYNRYGKTEIFDSEEELFQKWPQFNPENMYDWSQSKGSFPISTGREDFLWKNINGRYYLDEETFNRISCGFSTNRRYGYTDLILTREAIKNEAWKLFSYRGLDYLSDFLNDFPKSRDEYTKSIWDSHTSLFAEKLKMNHFELIRMRLPPHEQ